jgi:elongation factor G
MVMLLLCRGSLIGHPVENVRIVLTDGASHAVDSSELAFKLAAIYAFRKVCLYLILVT